jgi:prophage regulatory protein
VSQSQNKPNPRTRSKNYTSIPITMPAEGFVRMPTVLAVFGTSKSTLWRWIKEGKFVAPDKLGPNSIGWDVAKLRAHMDKIRQGAA